MFAAARTRFQEIDSVSGGISGEDGSGLGPGFNSNSCASCHAQPDVGGSSPAVNPQPTVGILDHAANQIPEFILFNGPVREARFIQNPDGTPDGGVHDLFTIAGRTDAPGCVDPQPDFATALAQNNVIFRIPTPVFGAGLVEDISDTSILNNAAANAHIKYQYGISGRPNRSGNDGSITRFGWKAQNKSLLIFSGEAYNVEQGVTNEAFPNERDTTPSCQFGGKAEDNTNLTTEASTFPASGYSSDLVNFAMFMRLSAPPTPAPQTPQTQAGFQTFVNIGCALCHTPSINTGATSFITQQSNVQVNAFSDFLLHNMGSDLADHVSQGAATGNEFRTAPLWGLGQRIFFLHDGRTSNLVEAIKAHESHKSEANQVIENFRSLSHHDKQNLLLFLRSL
ncbi:MAG: di-heme oxidoredictase family protein [Candidatus Acidiferrales bacterium]